MDSRPPSSQADALATATGETPAIAEISREIVRLHARYYGRGPTQSKTTWRNGVVCCILGEIFTQAERTLVDAGRFDQVRANRQSFQDMMEPLMRGLVEGITNRGVIGFLSQISPEGIAAEVFVLREDGSPAPRARPLAGEEPTAPNGG